MSEKLALDLDSTIAGTAEVALDLVNTTDHNWSYDDIESWDWGLDKWGTAAFLSGLWHSWTLRPDQIQPLEKNLSWTVHELQKQFTVDIVTAHPDHMGITEGKKQWLADRNIEYNEFVVVDPDTSKAKMDYGVFIDDKPSLVGKMDRYQRLYLRDQRYNSEKKLPWGDFTRVSTVKEVLEYE